MPLQNESRPGTWSIILAGGRGHRMSPFVRQWLGRDLPKQFCRFTGKRSMFQHTVDRADSFVGPDRRLTVIMRTQFQEVLRQLDGRRLGGLVIQPEDRGNGIAVLTALSYVTAEDPGAVVAILPSDHFIQPENLLSGLLEGAVRAARVHPNRIFLAGAHPDAPETEYGWIVPGGELAVPGLLRMRQVERFREKPGEPEARALYGSGAVWNTMILVGRASAFWNLARKRLMSSMPLFDALILSVGTQREAEALFRIYERVPRCDLGADLLQPRASRLAMFGLRGIRWSDWGRPERIARSLASLGLEPAFPAEMVPGAGVEARIAAWIGASGDEDRGLAAG